MSNERSGPTAMKGFPMKVATIVTNRGTIRLKLLKIGAQVKISVRRVLFSMASAFPYVDDYAAAWAALHSAA